jgi:Putative zinc-binding metallo-peptidase
MTDATEPRAEARAWETLADEELLRVRICDLRVNIAESELEPRVQQLYAELEARSLALRPVCYLGDEWFSPEGVPAISIPFYLAHPRLKALEQSMLMEVEGGDPAWCQRLLRHECGHAIDHAFSLQKRRRRRELFGPNSADYDPNTYRPQPYSKSFVQNLPKWYAQAHPDEDWAETFAVWLDPESDWKKRYRGWKALAKLEYMDEVMRRLAGKTPRVSDGPHDYEIRQLRTTLGGYYKKRKRLYAADAPDFYDRDLRKLFGSGPSPSRRSAAAFMRRRRKQITDCVSRWTGERKITIESLTKKLTERAETLGLLLARDEADVSTDVAAYLATLVSHYRFTGKFKRSV